MEERRGWPPGEKRKVALGRGIRKGMFKKTTLRRKE
jgi:hypothetical protein